MLVKFFVSKLNYMSNPLEQPTAQPSFIVLPIGTRLNPEGSVGCGEEDLHFTHIPVCPEEGEGGLRSQEAPTFLWI